MNVKWSRHIHSLVIETSLQTETEDIQETLEEQSTSDGD
jgi:hypothetical protein